MANLISIQINGLAKVEENLNKVEYIIRQASEKADKDANSQHKLVVLPECFSIFGVTGSDMLQHAEVEKEGIVQRRLSDIAIKYCCYLVAGTTPIVDSNSLRATNKYYAASMVYSPSGKCIARYNKIHMFDVEVEDATKSYKESRYTQAGKHLSLFKTPFAEVAQSVCYDLRFPDMFSAYSEFTESGFAPDIIVVPSAFTHKTGSAHWHALLKARSIENQCYIVASNQVGSHADKRTTYGNSCIYSPWGECLSLIENEEGFAMAPYNKDDIDAIRAKMPIRSHKKERYTIER
jgi:predicted amidohydrolase